MNKEAKRGIFLSGYLIFALITAGMGVTSYVLLWDKIAAVIPAWAHASLTLISILRVFTVLAIWFWSRTGVIAYLILSVTSIPILIAIGFKVSPLMLIGVVLLFAVVYPKWKYMTWGLSLNPIEVQSA